MADLHSWRNNEPRSLGIPEVEGWWKPVLDFGTLETGLVVGRNRLPSRADRNTFVSEPTPNRPTALDPVRGQATENLIRNFVALHHQKVSNRDLDGYVADYAMKTDYFGTNKVSRQTIREDQGKYFAKYSRKITETIKGRVAVRGLGNELYEAKYDLNSSAAGKEEWNWISATSEVTLGIQILDESPQIVSQSAKVRDVEHGEP